jgi:methylated-DNA-[protein]-cysteine S-methyltransferase
MTTSGVLDSPIGPLQITVTDRGVSHVHFGGEVAGTATTPLTGAIVEELRAYFAGELQQFTVPVDLAGVSEFTRKVLEATATIPYGETVSYGEIARMIGMPGATQAVGNALGANPVPIVIPCHRVVRSDGSMGWFTGGPRIKRALLRLEGIDFPEQAALPL